MYTNTVIYAQDRFLKRAVDPTRTERVLAAVGRFKTSGEVSDAAAYTYGKRRLVALGAPLVASAAILGSAIWNQNSAESAERYEEKIEACATALTGSPVTIKQDIDTNMQVILAQDFSAVQACRESLGDANLARAKQNVNL